MPLTAKQILAYAFPDVKKAARGVVLHADSFQPKYVTAKHKLGARNPKMIGTQFLTAEAHSVSTGPDGAPKRTPGQTYKISVRGRTPADHLHEGNVVVSCNCDYFTFTSEVALNKKGAAQIIHSNGERPDIRNPRMVPTPCKHLYAVLNQIVKQKVGKV